MNRQPFLRSSYPRVVAPSSISRKDGSNTAASAAVVADDNIVGNITFLIPSSTNATSKFGRNSPVGSPSVGEAVEHLAQKSVWFANGRVQTSIYEVPHAYPAIDEGDDANNKDDGLFQSLCDTDVLIALGVQSDSEMRYLQRVFAARRHRDTVLKQRQCQFALDCAWSVPGNNSDLLLPTFVGPYDVQSPSLASQLLPWTRHATARRLHDQMQQSFARWTSDEFCFALMIFLNEHSGSRIDWVKHSIDATWEKGPIQNAREFYGMVAKCSDCIGRCLNDDTCRECITKLSQVDTRDQVTSYRTIVSYESDLLKDFSQCILTKNNVFQCDAEIPKLPKVTPIVTWRGQELTEQAAKSILVGHLDDPDAPEGSLRTNVSWKVACGANVAYDQFPSQHQLFYASTRGRNMWYDPVFRVETLDGRHVWCTRHYRVRPQPVPGTFRFSFLDNGVTSDEFWTIVDVAEDLSWIVFHYAGAAAAVGQQYLGGLLCTPDGSRPHEDELPRIWSSLRSAGIQPWELYQVDNRVDSPGAIAAGPPPLDKYRADVFAKRETAMAA